MDLAVALAMVGTILSTIQCLDKYTSMVSFPDSKRKLAELESTVNTVKSVLEDADSKQDALNSQEKNYIEDLKDAIYDAEDVLDEFLTLVKQKKLREANHKLSDKVKSFCSRFNRTIFNLSSKVKLVNKKLDAIASNSNKFLFKIDKKSIRFTKEETCSFVSENDKIIGRERDLETIVELLLDSNDVDQPKIVSLTIVGMGGLGKTALAQLVYNDPRITRAFQLKCWTCIADQDQEQWSLCSLLGKVLRELSGGNNHHDSTSLELMKREVEKHLRDKKYLIVLDDVWTENYERWLGFEKFLKVGQNESRIVITTRSKDTAKMIGGQVYELQGLSGDESWCLFERMAFLPEQRETPDDELVKLGEEIVKKCTNVPLAIRVAGSLLRGQLKCRWELFQDKGLANIFENDTMNHILKLSYHQLDSSLKSCFSYCAIFTKDFVINKQMLISLWMAQGYINLEYVGEEYVRILLQRCFFQDAIMNSTGEIIWFKIHDLFHDMAEQVVGKEICKSIDSDPPNGGKKIRHITLLQGFCPQETFNKTHIRTCFQVSASILFVSSSDLSTSNKLVLGNSIRNWRSLRSLDLSCLGAESLPESIGKLFHLRYLNLTESSYLYVLPNSITKLVNLQVLILVGCKRLKELPKDIHKLVDLTTLNIALCEKLSRMPSNLAMLTKLHTLGQFVVRTSLFENRCFDGLEVLRSLNSLKGYLQIYIVADHQNANYNYIKEDYGGGDYIKSKEHLKTIHIIFSHRGHEEMEWEQELLEDMQPHVNTRDLFLQGYSGKTIPRWPNGEDNSTLFYLPSLVSLTITDCRELRFLPSLEKLPYLKELILRRLPSVEYVVNVNHGEVCLGEAFSFFPCLELLRIDEILTLKGWWPKSGKHNEPSPCFKQLKYLEISDCPMLNSIPICPRLEKISVVNVSGIAITL